VTLYYDSGVGRLYCDDCLKVMKTLPDKSVQCGITSPPYWGMRDYGVDGQLGLESTPEEYVENLIKVFGEFRRVLKDDGTLWLNLGDSYTGSGGNHKEHHKNDTGFQGKIGAEKHKGVAKKIVNLKSKNLVGIPWRAAFALQADGWYLRQDIIWHKPNPMPESVTDRCTKAHEYIFLLSKSPKYYFDNEAIRESVKPGSGKRMRAPKLGTHRSDGNYKEVTEKKFKTIKGANKRSVWTVTTKPLKEAHFATFPPDLILPCVLAGCPESGVVMDMFFGSGTTGLVAAENNRRFIGIELSEKYCEIAVKRISPIVAQMTF